MKAPDKAFIRPDAFEVPWAPAIDENDKYGGIEYIRKDSLLEWAKEHKKAIEVNGDERDAYTRGEYSVINSLIDKLNSM